jgi:hypothetical protein
MQPRHIAMFSSVLVLVFVAAVAARSGNAAPQAAPAAARVERGRYLVEITGCHDCHSPKVDARMTRATAIDAATRPGERPDSRLARPYCVVRSVGQQLRGEPDARPRDRPRQSVHGRVVRAHDPYW